MSAWEWLFVDLIVSGSVSVSENSEQLEREFYFLYKNKYLQYMSSLSPKVSMLINVKTGVSVAQQHGLMSYQN